MIVPVGQLAATVHERVPAYAEYAPRNDRDNSSAEYIIPEIFSNFLIYTTLSYEFRHLFQS